MSRGKWTFKQRDVGRVMRAAKGAGYTVRTVEVTPEGRIVVNVDTTEAKQSDAVKAWDELTEQLILKRKGQ